MQPTFPSRLCTVEYCWLMSHLVLGSTARCEARWKPFLNFCGCSRQWGIPPPPPPYSCFANRLKLLVLHSYLCQIIQKFPEMTWKMNISILIPVIWCFNRKFCVYLCGCSRQCGTSPLPPSFPLCKIVVKSFLMIIFSTQSWCKASNNTNCIKIKLILTAQSEILQISWAQ